MNSPLISSDSRIFTSPRSIIEYTRKNNLINLAESSSALHANNELINSLQGYTKEYSNQRSPKFGTIELREFIANHTKKLYDYNYCPQKEITITAGIKQAVFSAILALIKEGDDVVIFEPTHQSYKTAINIVGANAVYVPLKQPSFEVNWDDVQKVITPNTRMIIINTPQYPTGSIFTELDMLRLQKVINGTNVIIVSDESFEQVLFDGNMQQSVCLYPKLQKKSIIVSSFSESLLIPNWNISFCSAPEHYMKSIRKVLASMSEGVPLPCQMAVNNYLQKQGYDSSLFKTYQDKRDQLLLGLDDTEIKLVPSMGTYFQLINIESLTSKNDVDFAIELMEKHGLATMPTSFYYHQKVKSKHLRLNISVGEKDLEAAIEVLNKVAK